MKHKLDIEKVNTIFTELINTGHHYSPVKFPKIYGYNLIFSGRSGGKTTLKYFDNPAEVCYTDRRGTTQTVYIPSCATIEKIPFNASLSSAYDYLKNLYR